MTKLKAMNLPLEVLLLLDFSSKLDLQLPCLLHPRCQTRSRLHHLYRRDVPDQHGGEQEGSAAQWAGSG